MGLSASLYMKTFLFVDQYIPEPSTIVSTAVIGLVAASSPLILNIIKPAIKNIVKKTYKEER